MKLIIIWNDDSIFNNIQYKKLFDFSNNMRSCKTINNINFCQNLQTVRLI